MSDQLLTALIAATPPTVAAVLGYLANRRSLRRSVGTPPGLPLARVIERVDTKVDRVDSEVDRVIDGPRLDPRAPRPVGRGAGPAALEAGGAGAVSVSGGRYDADQGRKAGPPESVFVIDTVSGEEGVALEWKGYESLRAMGRLLSAELDFHDYTVIRNGQLYLHSQLWEQGRGDEPPGLDADRVLDGDPSAWQPHLLIDVRLGIDDDLLEELNRARGAEDEGLAEVWATWREQEMSFDDRAREEAKSYGPVVLKLVVAHAAAIASMPAGVTHELFNNAAALTLLSVQSALRQAGVPEARLGERAAEYLRSGSLSNVPFNRISSLLYAALARRARAGQKGVTRGMTNDIRMISTLLPYVDAMFIDRECHLLLSEHPVPERMGYSTELFSHRNKDDFIAYLDAIESSATPEHLALVEEVYGAV